MALLDKKHFYNILAGQKTAIKVGMTANIIPDVEDAFPESAAPMYTVPKFCLSCLHQTEIHFRSSTYKASLKNSVNIKIRYLSIIFVNKFFKKKSNRHSARERQGDILVVEEGQDVLGTISRVIILIRFL